jgi:hypothetical protein
MGHLLIQRSFGSLAIGDTAEGNGFGFQGAGQNLRGLRRFGFLDTGNREKEVGSGIQDIGNTVKKSYKFEVSSFRL